MGSYVLGLNEVNPTMLAIVGGKGANLGALSRVQGINVPEGFCISADACKYAIEGMASLEDLQQQIKQITRLKEKDREKIVELSATIRMEIEKIPIPDIIRDEITLFLSGNDESTAYAIRSSATAEDLPAASFAGLQDTYLNIVGTESILKHISRCWASLYTDRAVMYRIRNGFDHWKVNMAVIVQKMVFSEASGIIFTAHPLNSNRKVLTIDAGFGLGDSLVSGLVNADSYSVKKGIITEKRIAHGKRAIHEVEEGYTKEWNKEPGVENGQVLTDQQILQLETIGRKIEEYFGSPQDIEWCLAEDKFYIVQSRPITTLYPIPESHDQENHVYISVGHQQMMTDPMKPLGLSFFLLTTPAPMRIAGGRLFVDITSMLSSPNSRDTVVETLGKSDPLIKSALLNLLRRGDGIPYAPNNVKGVEEESNSKGLPASGGHPPVNPDPSIVSELIQRNQLSLETLQQTIRNKSGLELFDFILEDIRHLKQSLFDPQSLGVIHAAIDASAWLNDKIMDWLGEKGVADIISQSVPHNITSEMGLELLDVADAIRPYPDLIKYLEQVKDENFLDGLDKFDGGKKARKAFQDFLLRYGMRCAGEIDISRPRWIEKKTTLIPLVLSHIRNFGPHAGKQKWGLGLKEAMHKQENILRQLKSLPGGDQKAEQASRRMALIRNFIGFREYPKYGMVNRYLIYKQALLKESQQLLQAGVISEIEDIYYLSFEEFREVVRTRKLNVEIISKRKEDYRLFEKLTPPRVITSDGEIIAGKYNSENLPSRALPGLAVSSGVAEGRARVIFKLEEANLEEGDILVTTFTDPGWTSLFVSIKALVTEVGGLMTHGAVIAREYGLPAVVGVEHATQLIRDGQRIRVNGTEGYVEIL